jgi:hypothetical protein
MAEYANLHSGYVLDVEGGEPGAARCGFFVVGDPQLLRDVSLDD